VTSYSQLQGLSAVSPNTRPCHCILCGDHGRHPCVKDRLALAVPAVEILLLLDVDAGADHAGDSRSPGGRREGDGDGRAGPVGLCDR
jgi:hypothetical protein